MSEHDDAKLQRSRSGERRGRLPEREAERALRAARKELERKQRELGQQQEWFSVTLASIVDAVVTLDGKDRVSYMNPAAENLLGRTFEQLRGCTLPGLLALEDLESGAPLPLGPLLAAKGEAPGPRQAVLVNGDERRTVVEYRASPIRDAAGRALGVLLVFHDATEKHRAEAALRAESEAFEILNSTGAAIASQLDLETTVQTVTDAATRLSGAEFGAFFYTSRDAQGNAFLLYTLSGARREQFEHFGHPRDTPMFAPTFRGEAPVIRLDDVMADPRYGRWAPHHGMPPGHLPVRSYLAVPVISHSGEVIGGLFFGHSKVGVFSERLVRGIASHAAIAVGNARLFEAAQREIASRQQAEQALREADRRKDEFLATLAHELRNPLAPIRQAASLWSLPDLDPEQLEWSHQVVARQSRHMSLLLDDLLDVSRITRGQLALRREWIRLQDLVDAALETAAPLIAARGHRLLQHIEPPGLALLADPLRLAQVLANLLTNAAKYTEGPGEIHLDARCEGEELLLAVRDTGVGLEAGNLTRIFEMFSQTAAAIERREGGLGIGLALVKGLVELHGGSVEAHSEGLGRGSEFRVRLPRGAAPTQAQEGMGPSVTAAPSRARRVLIADDNSDMAESLALYLRLHGHEVSVVHDGDEAVAASLRQQPDYAILDIGMPGLNGYEAASRIRAGAERPPRLVALTGWGQEKDKREARRAGFDLHFTKPVDLPRLLALLDAPLPGEEG